MFPIGRAFLARRYRFSQVRESCLSGKLVNTDLLKVLFSACTIPGGQPWHECEHAHCNHSRDCPTWGVQHIRQASSSANEAVEEYWDLTDDEWEFEQDRWKTSKARREEPILASGNHKLLGNLDLMEELGMNAKEMKRMVGGAKAMTHSRPCAINNKINWCEDTLDMEPEEIKEFLLKYPWVLNYSSQIQLRPFTEACFQRGLDRATYKELVVNSPDILRQARLTNIERLMDGFISCGFTVHQFLRMAAVKHDISNYSVKKLIKPLAEKFLEFGLTLEDFVAIIPHAPDILMSGDALDGGVVLDRLLEYGLTEDQIERLNRKNPTLIGSDLERRLNWWT